MRRRMLTLKSLASLRKRKLIAMTGPAMPIRIHKEPIPNLIPMSRKKSTSRRACLHERLFRHLVAKVTSRLHCLVPHSLLKKEKKRFGFISNRQPRGKKHVMCVGARSGSIPGPLDKPSALTNCASCCSRVMNMILVFMVSMQCVCNP